MRVRTIWCNTLLLLCHHALWSQVVTKQLPVPQTASPQAGQADPQSSAPAAPSADNATNTPGSTTDQAPFTLPAIDNGAGWGADPAFAPPPLPTPAPAIEEAPATDDRPAPEPLPPPPASGPDEDPATAHPIPPPPAGTPVHIEADTQSKNGDIYTLHGAILIDYKQYVVHADHATFDASTSQVNATGHVTVDGGPSDEHLLADHGTMNLDAHTAHFYQVTGTLGVRAVSKNRVVFTAPNPFAITGEEVLELGAGNYQVIHGSMTSCRLPNPDWRLLAQTILVDDGEARAKNSLFELRDLPFFYLPFVSHPVATDQRQSGILLPIFGNSTTKGFIAGEEVYLALGRSADFTLGSQYFSRRGFSPMGQFRYKGAGEDFGMVRFRALLDRLPDAENQGGVDIVADGRRDLSPHTRTQADIEYLSSYVYRLAFEENYSAAINSEVKSQAFLVHEQDGLAASAGFERYQSFRSDSQGDEIRVLHTPELHLDAVDRPLGGVLGGNTQLLWGGEAEATAMSRSEPGFQTSRFTPRVDLYPHLALPLSAGGWTLRSEAGFRETFYGKSQTPGAPGQVPTEVGAGLNRSAFASEISLRPPAVERDFGGPFLHRWLGGDLRHTIEPDFTYRYVTGINNFNSVLRFDSTDVVSDTNEIEYGLTQHLFLRHLHPHPCKGDEALGPSDLCGGGTVDWLTWRVAQKYFFDPTFGGAVTPYTRNVLDATLDFTGVAFLTRPRNTTPITSRLRVRTTSATDLEWDLDYDTRAGRLQSSNISASYRSGPTFFSIGDYSMHNLGAQSSAETISTPTTTPAGLSDFNQLRLAAVYGGSTKHGLSAGVNLGYDFTLNQIQYTSGQLGFNRDCCGLSFEVRRYSLGTVRDDTQYLFSFTLAGVGAAGNLNRALRVF